LLREWLAERQQGVSHKTYMADAALPRLDGLGAPATATELHRAVPEQLSAMPEFKRWADPSSPEALSPPTSSPAEIR